MPSTEKVRECLYYVWVRACLEDKRSDLQCLQRLNGIYCSQIDESFDNVESLVEEQVVLRLVWAIFTIFTGKTLAVSKESFYNDWSDVDRGRQGRNGHSRRKGKLEAKERGCERTLRT